MLLSPGNSPRHLSTPTPSSTTTAEQTPNPNSSTLVTSTSTGKRHRNQTVLDEDAYVASIEKIIERDFFPDIPKLKDRLDWLQAVRTRDPVLIRDAQLKIVERRRLRKSNVQGSTLRDTTTTPGSTFYRNPSITPSVFVNSTNNNAVDSDIIDNDNAGIDGVDVVNVSLDEFFRKYTSEDNESFSKIMEKDNRKREERFAYLLEGEKVGLIENEDGKREKVNTDGYGTSDQPVHTLESWKYTAKNMLMYHPADNGEVGLTEEEKAFRLKGMTKEVSKANTRFHGKALDVDLGGGDKDGGEEMAVMYAPVFGSTPMPMMNRDGDKMKYDLDDLRRTPAASRFYLESEKKAANGYNYVKTPSPAPGVEESPFITWGEIEGTPLRLEPEETPIDIGGSGNGPQFKIPLPPVRDLKAHSLSREAARKIRERSKMFQKPPLHSPIRGVSASPRGKTFSPAARKFMKNAIAKSSRSIDESLRASYRSASPGMGTPKSVRSVSRLGTDGSLGSKSPSVREGASSPW